MGQVYQATDTKLNRQVENDIFEGMWQGFNIEPDLPETRDAAADLARFLDRHMASSSELRCVA